ncbi:MAG: hypothetical protein ACOYOU_11440 [Kiritimatiellia bacterium]
MRLATEDALEGLGDRLGARVSVFPLGLEDIFIELFGKESQTELHEERT